MFAVRSLSALLLSAALSGASAGEFNGELKSQSAYGLESREMQQQEWLIDLEYTRSLGRGELTAIGRIRIDTQAALNESSIPSTYASVRGPLLFDDKGLVELREFYWDYAGESVYWRLGKQQVVWGEADGLKLLDVINPQSFREFILDDFDDSRIPLWMVNAEYTVNNGAVIQALWIPDTTTHHLAPEASPFALTSPLFVPQRPEGLSVLIENAESPSLSLGNGDLGLRYLQFVGGWDISANYLYHYLDAPVLRSELRGEKAVVTHTFERSHLLGGTLSKAFGDWTLRAEFAYETDRYHRSPETASGVERADQWSSVVGLDFQGWTDQFISAQWFQTSIRGNAAHLIANQREEQLTFLWESKFLNEVLSLKYLHLHSLDHGDGMVQSKLSYNLESNLDVYVRADFFYGDSDKLFGQFDSQDRLALGFEWGF